jgi:surface polysaccharide O-acyltransferase-like enzyme
MMLVVLAVQSVKIVATDIFDRAIAQAEIHYINTLRVLAITAVIMGHIFMTICSYFTAVLTNTEVNICVALRNMWHWCIPVFVMISGVLFLNPQKEISIEKLLKKYIPRLLLALLVFGVPYAFAEQFVSAQYHFSAGQIGAAFLMVLRGTAGNHLWYLYFVIGLYLIIPVMRAFTDNAGQKTLEYALVVLFMFTGILPLLKNVFHFSTGFYIPINSVYVFYFLLGHYIHHYNININTRLLIAVISFYLVYAALMPLKNDLILSTSSGRLISLEQDSPIIALVSAALFCLFHQKNKTSRIINFLSPLCFGVYLIHPLFLFSLYLFLGFTPEKCPLVLFILTTFVFTTLPSIGFSYLFHFLFRRGNIRRYTW